MDRLATINRLVTPNSGIGLFRVRRRDSDFLAELREILASAGIPPETRNRIVAELCRRFGGDTLYWPTRDPVGIATTLHEARAQNQSLRVAARLAGVTTKTAADILRGSGDA